MAHVIGQDAQPTGPSRHAVYPDKPTMKVFMDTPNPEGYTSQLGQYGSRAGTILPHAGAGRSFEQLGRPKHSVPISVVAIRDATTDNPFGGIDVLVPSYQSGDVTEEMQKIAHERAQQMYDDPVNQGVAKHQILAELIRGGQVPAAAPAPPPPPASAPAGPIDQQALMMQLARMFGLMQQQQPVPVPPPQPVPQQLPPPPAATPYYPPPQPQYALPPPPAPPVPQHYALPPAPPPAPPPSPFAGLDIPGLGVVPGKPGAQVQFDLGQLGNQMAFYHWVIQEKFALSLIFDTRYDYPVWTPPSLGPDQTMDVTLANARQGSISIPCYSCGLSFRFGVFQVTVLLIANAE